MMNDTTTVPPEDGMPGDAAPQGRTPDPQTPAGERPGGSGPGPAARPQQPSRGMSERDERQWAMLCHLAALSGLLGNGIGFLLGPLVVWLLRREDSPFIDDQGKEAVNFQITMFLALLVSLPFVLVLIGIPMMLTIGLIMTVMPVVGAIRASEGRTYRYPLSIRFIR